MCVNALKGATFISTKVDETKDEEKGVVSMP